MRQYNPHKQHMPATHATQNNIKVEKKIEFTWIQASLKVASI